MAKKLVSFRLEEDRIKELQELANVYTNGNSTRLIEALVRRMYFLEPLALQGEYRTPGFGVDKSAQKRFKDAWDIWVSGSAILDYKPDATHKQTPIVYTQGRKIQLSESAIKEICDAVPLAYNPGHAFNIYAYWG